MFFPHQSVSPDQITRHQKANRLGRTTRFGKTTRFGTNTDDACHEQTFLILEDPVVGEPAPRIYPVTVARADEPIDTPPAEQPLSLRSASPSWRVPRLVTGQWSGSFARPSLRGFRIIDDGGVIRTGRDWSPFWRVEKAPAVDDDHLSLAMKDGRAGLRLVFDCEKVAGGSLRMRLRLQNCADGVYMVEGLELHLPLPDDFTDILDFTGRHERERTPQRHHLADGTWLREGRRGKPSFEGATLIAGTAGFDFSHGSVIEVQPAWSGNTVLAVDRDSEDSATICAGELLLPGEIALRRGEWYSTPWVLVTASDHGLDGAAQSVHRWQRSLPAHPDVQPVTLNVWEAVYMHHSFEALADIARRAADLGVERFVVDDGWFHLRRDDDAGLGDWWVDPEVWPKGLGPLIDFVHRLGMDFGLWFEPEMINPNSDAYRQHPQWALHTDGRLPMPQRNQQVLDLTNPDAYAHVLDQMSALFEKYPIDYVKWDHNRDLLEAGSTRAGEAPAVHGQTLAFYRLLDELHARFPKIVWESCASGGGRIDMGVIERVSRFWTSDVTDALSRQQIQRWTVQNIAPEYIGAHVSAPTSHQTHRTFSLDFRAATAVFSAFGIEWDIRQASPEDTERLRQWIIWYKNHRHFLHCGNAVRLDVDDPAVYAYGTVGADGARAIIAHAQLHESVSNRGMFLRVPGLDADADYQLRWSGPAPAEASLESLNPAGPIGTRSISGAMLARRGVWIPRCRPETIRLIDIRRVESD
jgi:alpha-galactosidase